MGTLIVIITALKIDTSLEVMMSVIGHLWSIIAAPWDPRSIRRLWGKIDRNLLQAFEACIPCLGIIASYPCRLMTFLSVTQSEPTSWTFLSFHISGLCSAHLSIPCHLRFTKHMFTLNMLSTHGISGTPFRACKCSLIKELCNNNGTLLELSSVILIIQKGVRHPILINQPPLPL